MNKKQRTGLVGLVLAIVLMAGFLAVPARAAEPENRFVLVAEAGGKLIFAPGLCARPQAYGERQVSGTGLL